MALFVNGGGAVKIVLPPKKNGSKRPSLERKFRLRRLRTAAARKRGGILGKLKQLERVQQLTGPRF